ncbi:MAG: restriction endonuclease subunit S [Bacteroidales bacterium]|nr:restriction endonuclease subunit S [Bacteroidales bacterium]
MHKAFTGELTKKWRAENGVGDESWEEKTVGECCSEVKVGIVIKPTRYYAEQGIPAFRSANVRENHIDNFDWVYLNEVGMRNEQRSIVHTGDVLVVRSGAPGTACVVTQEFDGYNAIDILIAVPEQKAINSYFLCYYTNSPMGKNIVAEKKRGLGLTHFNVKGYSATPIKVPSLSEQTEIVRILDNILKKETKAKEAAEAVLEQIDLLKKSILARAFRGEI